MKESEQNAISDSYPNNEIDLKELFGILWESKKLIILMTSIIAICSVVFSLMLTNYYRSEAVLVSADSQDYSSLSQYAGLASIAGVSLPSSGDDGLIEIMEIIKSREFVKHLLTFENILPSIMAVKKYDATSQELYFDPDIYDEKTKTWTRKPAKNKGSKPSYLETHEVYLNDMLTISHNQKTGLVSIVIEHISPSFSKDFLSLIIQEANNLKRKKDLDITSDALNYLKNELSNTPLLEMKESISQLIEAQLQTQMTAKINEEYSLVIIDPPFIPEKKSKPFRSLIVALATMIGSILSVMIVLFRHYFLVKRQ